MALATTWEMHDPDAQPFPEQVPRCNRMGEQRQAAFEGLKLLLPAFDEILAESYHGGTTSGSRDGSDVVADSHDLPQLQQPPSVEHCTCDFCGADIFQSFFECPGCSGEANLVTPGSILICTACYSEGRTCLCGRMEPAEIRPFSSLLSDRNRVAKILAQQEPDSWKEIDEQYVHFL